MPRLTVGVKPGGRIRLLVPPAMYPTEVWVSVISFTANRLQVTVEAPSEVNIHREELLPEGERHVE